MFGLQTIRLVQDQILSANWQQAGKLEVRVIGFYDNSVGLLPTPLGVEVLHRCEPCPGEAMSSFHHLL